MLQCYEVQICQWQESFPACCCRDGMLAVHLQCAGKAFTPHTEFSKGSCQVFGEEGALPEAPGQGRAIIRISK